MSGRIDRTAQVRVLDLDTLTVSLPINVGSQPTGISLEMVAGVERAYVANRGSDSYTVIDVAERTVETTIPLPAGSAPTDLKVELGGLRLDVVAAGLNQIHRYSVPDNVRLESPVTTAPRRILVQQGGTAP